MVIPIAITTTTGLMISNLGEPGLITAIMSVLDHDAHVPRLSIAPPRKAPSGSSAFTALDPLPKKACHT